MPAGAVGGARAPGKWAESRGWAVRAGGGELGAGVGVQGTFSQGDTNRRTVSTVESARHRAGLPAASSGLSPQRLAVH